eukprot:c29574_g1_i1 orf=52-231(-)
MKLSWYFQTYRSGQWEIMVQNAVEKSTIQHLLEVICLPSISHTHTHIVVLTSIEGQNDV